MFYVVLHACLDLVRGWAVWARPFCVAVCEGISKTCEKLEAPLGRKLVENWRSETGRNLENSSNQQIGNKLPGSLAGQLNYTHYIFENYVRIQAFLFEAARLGLKPGSNESF